MQKIFISTIILSLTLSSCVVSKKKYDAAMLRNSKLSKELSTTKQENRSLNDKVNSMISEFEKMKNELHLSNAVKSDEMSNLLVKVTQLSDLNDQLKNELKETLSKYKSQKQTSLSVTSELEALKADKYRLAKDTASIRYALKLSKERFLKLENELKAQKEKYANLSSSSVSLRKEYDTNKQKLISFEQQLVENKNKIESISKYFIELRKELLSANASNKAIDPNKNKNVDKIAKELGHY